MNTDEANALKAVLELRARPSLAGHFSRTPLPKGLDAILRAAAHEADALRDMVQITGLEEAECTELAREYCRKVILTTKADDHRLLGLEALAPADMVSRHRRLLAKWLHPDVSDNPGDADLFRRMNAAAQRLLASDAKADKPAISAPAAASTMASRPTAVRHHLRTGSTKPKGKAQRQRVLQPLAPRLFRRLRQLAALMAVAAIIWFVAPHLQRWMDIQMSAR